MSTLKTWTLAGSFAFLGASAQAQTIEHVTMTSDPSDVVFTVRADKALSTPSVRTYDGQVRVRFPSADAPQAIQVNGDGAAIKLVDVRAGSHDSAVLRLELGDSSKLSADDVRIENRKHIMVVRIARDVLPPLREPRPEEPAKKIAPAKAPLALPAPARAPLALPASTKPSATKVTPHSEQKAATVGDVKKGASLNRMMAGPSASSPMPMLTGITAILGLAYGAMRLLMKKQKGTDKSRAPIDIVAQKRIGPRHQLVIVRAFGREHLLSIQGGNTTLIAANEEIDESFSDKLSAARSEEPSIEPQAAMIQNVAFSQRAEPQEKRPELTGGDLIRSAIAQRLSGMSDKKPSEASQPSLRSGNMEEKALSQAVAGLVRLRREAQL